MPGNTQSILKSLKVECNFVNTVNGSQIKKYFFAMLQEVKNILLSPYQINNC